MVERCPKCNKITDARVLIIAILEKGSFSDWSLKELNEFSLKEFFDGNCAFCGQSLI